MLPHLARPCDHLTIDTNNSKRTIKAIPITGSHHEVFWMRPRSSSELRKSDLLFECSARTASSCFRCHMSPPEEQIATASIAFVFT